MCVFLRAAAWLVNFPSVAHGRLSIRGRSSVTPCLEKTRTSQHPMSTSRVGPASAMGSGRVGCSSYPSAQFSDHAIIYFVFLFVLVTSRRCPRTITYTQTFCHGSPVGDTTSLRLWLILSVRLPASLFRGSSSSTRRLNWFAINGRSLMRLIARLFLVNLGVLS
jgi:hypothetical protein